jgi:hypothetical protein
MPGPACKMLSLLIMQLATTKDGECIPYLACSGPVNLLLPPFVADSFSYSEDSTVIYLVHNGIQNY